MVDGERKGRRENFLKKVFPDPFKDFQNIIYVKQSGLYLLSSLWVPMPLLPKAEIHFVPAPYL